MKKRFLSLVLLIAITCALCVSANASPASTLSSSYTTVTLTTAGGNTVSAFVFTSEYSSQIIESMNKDYDSLGALLIADPSPKYNCHSYAWHNMSPNNAYWINNISPYLNDSNCSEISSSQLQEFDIIVYYINGRPEHSGVIYDIGNDGTLTIRSKWGNHGIYEHGIAQLPSSFFSYLENGEPDVRYFRYHNYTSNRYTGNNYHYDVQHFFEYVKTCAVCGQQTAFWTSGPCSGPPCNTPWSLPDEILAA